MGGLVIVCIAILGIVVCIFIASAFYQVAVDKGYYEARYWVLPFFFPIVGYILVAALPDRGMDSGNHYNPAYTDKLRSVATDGPITKESVSEKKTLRTTKRTLR